MKHTVTRILNNPRAVVGWAAAIALVAGIALWGVVGKAPTYQKTAVITSSFSTDVSGQGVVETAQPVQITIPSSGRIQSVSFVTGKQVSAGDTIATIAADDAQGVLVSAASALQSARAAYDKLVSGATASDVRVSETAVEAARLNASEVSRAQDQLVENAHRALLNTDLAAVPYSDRGEALPPAVSGSAPVITGSYAGSEEGQYIVHLYPSGAVSGYSFEVSGLERVGPANVDTKTAVPLGTRGLYIRFPDDFARGVDWVVSVPNTRSASYTSVYNAYQAATRTRDQANAAAASALAQAQAALDLKSSVSRPEDIQAARAQVQSAEAAYNRAQDAHPEYALISPVAGSITTMNLVSGQSIVAGQSAVVIAPQAQYQVRITVSANEASLVHLGQDVDVSSAHAVVSEINKVDQDTAQITVMLDAGSQVAQGDPVQVRIVGSSVTNTLVVPRTAIETNGSGSYVLVQDGIHITERRVTVGLKNATSAEITSGLSEGEQVITFTN